MRTRRRVVLAPQGVLDGDAVRGAALAAVWLCERCGREHSVVNFFEHVMCVT